jgi:hypothetical protein
MKVATEPIFKAKAEIKAAWQAYQKVEKYGLEFGETVYKWREKFKSRAGCKSEGEGICAILHELGIPRRTAYWWIDKYEVSAGLKAAPAPKELDDDDNTYEPLNSNQQGLGGNWRQAFERDWEPTPEEQKQIDKISQEMVEEAARRKVEEELAEKRLLVPSGVIQMASDVVESGYRALSKTNHPDVGGNQQRMSELNAAITWLRNKIKQEAK